MDQQSLSILIRILIAASGVFTLYGIWFFIVALFGFKKAPQYPRAKPATRFAVLVAARNEEAVIGQLIDSLHGQNYPKELFDIFVAPNNCTDDTRGEVLRHGAWAFDTVGKVHGKGDVLHQLCASVLCGVRYDAVCVLDADNLAHPDFLQRMNDAYLAGAEAAQGFRNSKNPTDTAVSTCYSVCYWILNRFYNNGRAALGLSCLINGSGFMLSTGLLRRLGGWNTTTITEDYEITAQCVMQGAKVHYVKEAIIYDEQPQTFAQSWNQRRRWGTGSVQGMHGYLRPLVRYAAKNNSGMAFDLALTYAGPLVQVVSLLLGAVTFAVQLGSIQAAPPLYLLPVLALVAFGGCCALAAFVVHTNRGRMRGTGKGILFFALFLVSWLPIGLLCFFKPQKRWSPMAHTRAVSLRDVRAAL